MLNSFPQRAGNLDLLLRTFEEALRGFGDEIVSAVAVKFTKGEVPSQSLTFAPSIAEFVNAARDQVKLRMIALPRAPELPREGLERRQDRLRRSYAGRAVLAENIDAKQFAEGAGRRDYPAGSEYVAALGIVFAPISQSEGVGGL